MTPERWKRIEEVFQSALDLAPTEREQFIAVSCIDDQPLRKQVEELLAQHEQAGNFIEESPVYRPTRDCNGQKLIGKCIGSYQVLSVIGEGGMGQIYLARDERLGRKVVLKLLPVQFTHDHDRLRRFEQEARMISALNHPNIVTIYEIGEADIGRYIAMEFISGYTLREFNAMQQPSIQHLVKLAGQIARALDVAHSAGIVHRDIKPENIMIRDDGYVKVLDFGIARLTQGNKVFNSPDEPTIVTYGFPRSTVPFQNPAITASGIIIGTLRYMSPEQAQGETVSSATDIFSFGTVLYELMTGHHPFNSESQFGVMNAIIALQPLPPSRLNPEIPLRLEELILRMLEKPSQSRPSAAEVEVALAGLVGNNELAGLRVQNLQGRRGTVGHQQEREELRAAYESVARGSGLLVCVHGEPGIGKTTLVEDFLSELTASNQSYSIARGRCSERLAGTEAYLPFLEALDTLLRDDLTYQVARMMKIVAPTWYVHIGPLISTDSSEHLMNDIKTASQERMKREMSAFLEYLSSLRPLVFFLDDVHWADASTVDLLAYLSGKFPAMRLLILATYRSAELLLAKHPFLQIMQDLQSRMLCRVIPLQFLTTKDVEQYMDLEFPRHSFPSALPSLVHTKTEGSPLFMVDLVRYLRDRTVITEDEDSVWRLARSVPDIENDLPASVRSMIQRKIDQLNKEDIQLLAAASIEGYEFDAAVVSQALGIDPAETEERLDVLDRVHSFVRFIAEKEFPDHTLTLRFRFVHVLYQNALYASLKPTRRALLSARVAEALLGYYGEQTSSIAARLALLFEMARDFPRAADYFLLASRNDAQVFAYQEAVTLARRGLEMVNMLPRIAEHMQRELLLQTELGGPLMATMGYGSPEVERTYLRARELCEQLGDKLRLVPVMWGLWAYYYVGGELQTARTIAEQLLQLVKNPSEPLLNPYVYDAEVSLGITLFHLGDPTTSLKYLEQAISRYDQQHDGSMVPQLQLSNGVASLIFAGFALWILGQPDKGLKKNYEAIDLANRLSHPPSIALALDLTAWAHNFRREAPQAKEQSELALTIAREYGFNLWIGSATLFRGWALGMQGNTEEGLQEMRSGLVIYAATGAQLVQPTYIGMIAEANLNRGEIKEGLSAIDQALATAKATGERFCEPELYRLRAELLIKAASGGMTQDIPQNGLEGVYTEKSALFEAESHLHHAINLAQQQSAKSWELRAVMSLCRLWQKGGEEPKARELLKQLYSQFSEGFDTPDLMEAKALLENLAEGGR